ncbi:MAG: eukaryotic-like serine/threonine-protein kinase [Actinomycetota bacterium]|jgi:serine/threonine-protein kinase|nr:eukaryotic-like serine/threonine-protein kinase [Actinomycetota bacterium]
MSESVLGGRYRLEARIGAGGMAEVFRGFDTTLTRTVAIKTLNAPYARDKSFVERFRREAQAAARLSHPNIVATYDSGTDGDTQFIVMEFIEGRTLAEFLGAGKHLSPAHATQVAEEVCNALTAAHAHGVIHRDIKPGNIMVTRDGSVKVMDFGIARMISGPETAPQTSVVMGTATYISPEQAKGLAVDARSDLYSLGAVLYEMLAGRPPFVGESSVAVAYKQVNEVPEPPSAHNADVPPALDSVVMRALAKNPANRYQDAAAFCADLIRARNGEEVEATPLMPLAGDATQVISRPRSTQILPPVVDPPGSSRKVWLGILIGLLVVAVIAGAGVLLANSLLGDKPSPSAEVKPLPKVTGLPQAEAETVLKDAGFTKPVVIQLQGSDATEGTVIAQDPKAREPTSTDATITLTVAKPIQQVPVPDITTMTVTEAETTLKAVDLKLGTQSTEASATIPAGEIISQTPEAQNLAPRGTPVNVVVSTGTPTPTTVPVPDVTCRSVGSGTNQLEHAGFTVVNGGAAATFNPSCKPGSNWIASQSPTGTAPSGSTVTIYTNPEPSPSPSDSPSP